MKNLQRNLARLAAAGTASALLVVLPASMAQAGTAACVGKANVGGTEITQNTTTNSTLTHDLPATVDVGSPARSVNVVSNSSIDKEASGTAWSIGGRSVKGSTEASVVIGADPTRIPLPLDIPGVNMTEGQATYLKAFGSFRFTPPSTPQKVVFKTPDNNFNAVTKFFDGPLGTGNLKIDVQAVCDPAGEDTIGTPVFVMARSTTTMAAIEGPLTANSSNQVPVSVTVTGGTVSGKARLVVDGVERPLKTLVNGKAQLTLDNLAEGSHQVRADFVPNDRTLYHDSVSPVQSINVGPPAVITTTILSLAKKTVSSNEPVVATATITAATGSPAGTVTFSADGVDVATRPVAAGATSAQVSLTGLAPGARDIQATFVPAAPLQYASSVSEIATVVVRTPSTPTTTTVSVDKNPATTSDVVTAVATVTAASGTVSGTVQFFVDGTTVGGATPVSAGAARRTLGRLSTPGAREITAEFTPTNPSDFETSSGATTVTVTAPGTPTSTAMVLSATSGTSADTLVASVTVTGNGATPVGSVGILVDGAHVASGPVNGSGVATVTLPSLDAGTRSVRAVFVPTRPLVDQASQSAPQQVTIASVTSTTTLTVDPDHASAGRDITATAQVSTSAGTPRGTVNFFVDGVVRASAVIDLDGTARVTLPPLDQGFYQIVATFVPAKPGQQVGSTSAPRTLTLTQPVEAALTTTSATLEESTITVDDRGQVAVEVEAAGATPRGRIDILISGETVSTTLVEGRAAVSLPLLPTGEHTFVATFVPANAQIFKASRASSLTISVVRSAAITTTRLSLSPTTAAAGENVTATASVSTSRGTPLGSVAFSVDGGKETLVALSGLTSFYELTGLGAGGHTISARFVPTNRLNFAASAAGDRTLTVLSTAKVGTATGLAMAPSMVHENEVAQATVTVTAAQGVATGTVEVTMTDGAGFDEVVTATLANGAVTLTLPTYQSGDFDVRARYLPAGGTQYGSSRSGVRVLRVTPPPVNALQTRTDVSLSPAVVTAGGSAKARASVLWAGGEPRGTVSFFANGVVVGPPVAVVGGTASATLPSSIAGSFSITAAFTPLDPAVMAPSTAQDPAVFRVNRPAVVRTLTVLKLSPATMADGEVSTATAKVTADTGDPDGRVIFSVDGIETDVPLTGGGAVLPLTNYGVGGLSRHGQFRPDRGTRLRPEHVRRGEVGRDCCPGRGQRHEHRARAEQHEGRLR